MNKEKTLAIHRIKTKIATATRNEAKAKNKCVVAEAKVKKINEAFDAAKKVVDAHKKTLELAKKQILENRKLIAKYEKLLNIKYAQANNMSAESAKKDESIKAESKKVEIFKKRCAFLEGKLKKAIEEKDVKAKVVPQEDQAVKTADAKKAKVEAIKKIIEEKKNAKETKTSDEAKNESKIKSKSTLESKEKASKKVSETVAKKIAGIYAKKYRIPEAASMKILANYDKNEALAKIQSIANEALKVSTKSKATESKINSDSKTVETKEKINESAAEDQSVSLYSLFN